ncbi:hypothetical protein GA0070610_1799 [Micromonospora echinofusca]|uniref:Uncharacterized protein n=1 Tax=Micromonospora echinofusca TaxID=47858 RepID=A0A1C5G6M8_MICEH|nr:hypothetical protein [Micromonospora echinofusca]SCG15565.1 hypothetical protein GA0070610_1799 [Micromonospora echinofusca]
MELTLEAPRLTEAAPPLDLDRALQPGESGYFAGEWLEYPYDGGRRFESAYAGTLIGRWSGWAVWGCTRDVAAAVVTDQEHARRHWRAVYATSGLTEPRLSRALDADVCPMWWDGDVIVVDRRALGEDEPYLRIAPNERGRYVVMGSIWCWEEVPVDAADTVHGAVEL